MRKIICPECGKEEIFYFYFKKSLICSNCKNVMTKEEFNNCYEYYKKRKENYEKEKKRKEVQTAKARESGTLVIPMTYDNFKKGINTNKKIGVDPIKILNNIKKLLNSDKLSEKEKEDIKVLAKTFINEMNCTFCTHRHEQNYGFGGVHEECDILNDIMDNTLDYCNDLPIFLKNCPVKKYKL